MLILAILFTLVLVAAFAVVPARLGRRKPTRADGCCALLPAVLVWLWAACIWSKPGLTIGFDAFRCLGITAMVLWACGLAAGFRHASGRKWTAAALLLVASLGAEVFIGNLNFWATHSYEPVDLRAYLQEAEDDHNALTLDDEHTTLTFTGLDRELYNLQLSGLEYVYNGPHPEVQNPLFILNVAATDEATSASRQSWNWEVAANAPRSQVRSLDLSGKASTLTLTAYPYNGEYRQYPISYTLQTIYANVPRAFDFSLVRWAAVLALLSAVYALRPVSAAWRDAYLTHRKKYRPVVLLVAVILGAAAFFTPFADRFNAGVSTSFYNTADWDGGSRINFTLHIDDWASDAAAQYGALAHSLLNGRLDLEQDPPAAMQEMANPYDTAARQQAAPDALWDVAYYQGRYYVYFGVIPCLLFQLPFEALTGVRDLPPSLPMILLSWLFLLAAFGCIKQAARRWFPDMSAAAYLLLCAGIGTGSQIYYLLLRPSIYEYAILSGAAFVMLALWQWLLAANQPAKLYILLGTNALVQTGNEDSFINYYARMLDELRAALPNTTFYVQSILCATQETVEDDAPGLSPDHIGPINQQIKALCEERGLYYLDLNAEFSDENGYLLTDYAQPDGIHLTVSGYNKWVSYLCTHTPYSKNNPYQPGSTYYLSEEMQSQLADLP